MSNSNVCFFVCVGMLCCSSDMALGPRGKKLYQLCVCSVKLLCMFINKMDCSSAEAHRSLWWNSRCNESVCMLWTRAARCSIHSVFLASAPFTRVWNEMNGMMLLCMSVGSRAGPTRCL